MARNTHRPRADKKLAAAAYVAHGTYLAASAATNIPYETIRDWKNADSDFQQFCVEAQAEFSEQLKAQLTQIIDLAHANTLDRLRNGDEQVNPRTGERVRVPVRGKDCAIIGAVAIDKLRIIQGQPTKITADATKVEKLAEQFRAMGQRYRQGIVAEQPPSS